MGKLSPDTKENLLPRGEKKANIRTELSQCSEQDRTTATKTARGQEGNFPQPLTPAMLKQKHKSIPRNPLIANAFFLIKNIEQWGEGTNKIVRWSLEHGLKEPDFEEIGGGFLVRFYAPEDILSLVPEPTKVDLRELGLNNRQIEALRLMVNERKEMTNSRYREIFSVANKTAATDLDASVKQGLIKRIGRGRSTRYKASQITQKT